MNSRLAILLAKNLIFQVAQTDRHASRRVIVAPEEPVKRAEIAHAAGGVVVHYAARHERVISVDPVSLFIGAGGKLPRAIGRASCAEEADVLVQIPAVALERRIVNFPDAVHTRVVRTIS